MKSRELLDNEGFQALLDSRSKEAFLWPTVNFRGELLRLPEASVFISDACKIPWYCSEELGLKLKLGDALSLEEKNLESIKGKLKNPKGRRSKGLKSELSKSKDKLELLKARRSIEELSMAEGNSFHEDYKLSRSRESSIVGELIFLDNLYIRLNYKGLVFSGRTDYTKIGSNGVLAQEEIKYKRNGEIRAHDVFQLDLYNYGLYKNLGYRDFKYAVKSYLVDKTKSFSSKGEMLKNLLTLEPHCMEIYTFNSPTIARVESRLELLFRFYTGVTPCKPKENNGCREGWCSYDKYCSLFGGKIK